MSRKIELASSDIADVVHRLTMDVDTYKTIETSYIVCLDGEYIKDILRAMGINVPKNADVVFCTPGGGDWSNTSIDVDKEHPVRVVWKETTSG